MDTRTELTVYQGFTRIDLIQWRTRAIDEMDRQLGALMRERGGERRWFVEEPDLLFRSVVKYGLEKCVHLTTRMLNADFALVMQDIRRQMHYVSGMSQCISRAEIRVHRVIADEDTLIVRELELSFEVGILYDSAT